MTPSSYPNSVQLYGTMTSFGKFWFRYISPQTDNPLDPSIDFSVTAEADLPEILQVFEDFLKANKYDLDDRELTLSRKPPNFDSDDFWGDDGVSCVGNFIDRPWEVTYGSYDQGVAYIGSGLKGGEGEDHLSFSPCFGNSVVTFS